MPSLWDHTVSVKSGYKITGGTQALTTLRLGDTSNTSRWLTTLHGHARKTTYEDLLVRLQAG